MKKILVNKFQTRKAAIEFAKKVNSKAERIEDICFKYKVCYEVDTEDKK